MAMCCFSRAGRSWAGIWGSGEALHIVCAWQSLLVKTLSANGWWLPGCGECGRRYTAGNPWGGGFLSTCRIFPTPHELWFEGAPVAQACLTPEPLLLQSQLCILIPTACFRGSRTLYTIGIELHFGTPVPWSLFCFILNSRQESSKLPRPAMRTWGVAQAGLELGIFLLPFPNALPADFAFSMTSVIFLKHPRVFRV